MKSEEKEMGQDGWLPIYRSSKGGSTAPEEAASANSVLRKVSSFV